MDKYIQKNETDFWGEIRNVQESARKELKVKTFINIYDRL